MAWIEGDRLTPANMNAKMPSDFALSVQDPVYGAVADDATDATGAFQSALSALGTAGGGVLWIPRGTYRVTDTLRVLRDTVLRGAGREITTLNFVTSSATVGVRSADESAVTRNIILEDLELACPASGTSITALVRFRNVSYSFIERCRFDGNDGATTGVELDATSPAQTYYNVISGNQFLNLTTAIHSHDAANANRIVDGNVFLSNAGPVIILDDAGGCTVSGNAFQDNAGGVCVQLTGGSSCQFNLIANNKFENQLTGILLESGVQFNTLMANQYSVTTNRWVDNSGAYNTIFESFQASLNDVGQWPQIVPLFYRASLPVLDDVHRGGLIRIPGDSATSVPDAVYLSLDDYAGTNAWVRLASGYPENPNVFTDGATAPSVDPEDFPSPVFRCTNTSRTTITVFANGQAGQVIHVVLDANTVLQHNAAMQLNGDQNINGSTRAAVTLVNNNGQWVDTLRRQDVRFTTVGAGSGAVAAPSLYMTSEGSLGLFRSADSTLALSYGTLDLTRGRLSLSTTGTSLTSANVGADEIRLFVGGSSGATLAVRSGGTLYYFASSASTVG